MISEDHLIGWLCMFDYQDSSTLLPSTILDALQSLGWVVVDDDVDWKGVRSTCVTDKGRAVIDLNSPEWGIDPIPVE